jgi:hypothetical protein
MSLTFFQSRKFGKVCGFYLGETPVVLLTDFALIKEAFKTETLAARPSLPIMEDSRYIGTCQIGS